MTRLLQAVLRVFSLYLCNGSYMEVTLRPLTRLNHWLRGMLNSRADIARIQRRACKLATSEWRRCVRMVLHWSSERDLWC